MPIIATVGRKKWSVKLLFFILYFLLSIGALTILYPFALMLSSSVTTRLDYDRFALVPLSLEGRAGRFVSFLAERYGQADWVIFQGNYRDPQINFWDDLAPNAEGFFRCSSLGVIDESEMKRYQAFLATLPADEFGLYDFDRAQDKYDREVYQPLKAKLPPSELVSQASPWLLDNGSLLQMAWSPPVSAAADRIRDFKHRLPLEQKIVITGRILWLQWLQANWSLTHLNAQFSTHYQNLLEVPFLDPALRDSFFKTGVPTRLHGQLPEMAYARFIGSGGEWVDLPVAQFDYYLFRTHEAGYLAASLTSNYRLVVEYLITKGQAATNTVILVILSVGTALTVNPLAAYVLARFRLRATPAILLFCLATSAFPAEVSMIPSFLLLKNLNLLNTFAALVLPGAASGFTIFLLKGFYESLPQELYEAAEIDGAGELRKFFQITMPLSAPILAVTALGAFTAAYTGYMWAFVVNQNENMWTLMVWLFQFQLAQAEAGHPSVGMASLVVASLPTFLVFLFCQKIIMQGIIVPSMK